METPPMEWYDATTLKIEGKAWCDSEHYFDRLPARALPLVNETNRSLSKYSSGLAIRFASDAATLRIRWSLDEPTYSMNHWAATGTSGLDLYTRLAGGEWAYTGTGRPDEKTQEHEWTAFSNRPKNERTFLLNLPLFNAVTALSIGVSAGASFKIVPNARGKSVVFYGTSIVNGGCASRPGMTYPAIIGRALDCETVNLGFSGSARMEPVIADLLAELDPAAYVIDALPNMYHEPVIERTLNLVRTLRKAHPATPIVLVDAVITQTSRGLGHDITQEQPINAEYRAAYEELLADGVPGLTYLKGAALLGDDGEGTVDGIHPTDLGFSRMAKTIGATLARLLG
jgi:hypothetical protein